jgi:FtsP/CotA-like multicopper oxidase with cupredoxin domain/Cu/Ag efflux protein CusF
MSDGQSFLKQRDGVRKKGKYRAIDLLGAAFLSSMFLFPGEASTASASPVESAIPGIAKDALVLGRDLDGDGDPDEVTINLEVIEIKEEIYPGKVVTFWVFAPEGQGMVPVARYPSPTIRVEEGDRLKINLNNTHYFPHTIHFHGTIHPNAMDGVPDITQPAVRPGKSFTYEFIAKNPGTHFYHCHVQPDVHALMGLQGMFIIEPNRPRNNFRHLIIGAGEIKDLAKAQAERYDREYSLVYADIDDRLNAMPMEYADPRQIEKEMHREYDSTRRQPNIFLLNGRSFPFTLRNTPITVKPNERIKLRILNAGARTISLHTHGHHPILTHVDGYPVPENARIVRDVFTISAAQRIDLELRTTSDDYYSSGPGVWLLHDHTEQAVTNKGINPGGDTTVIVYEDFLESTGLPRTAPSLERFFDPNYYKAEIPIFDPSIFHSTLEDYEKGWSKGSARHHSHEKTNKETAHENPFSKPRADHRHPAKTSLQDSLEGHKVVARSCEKPRSFRRIELKAGAEFADTGEVFGFRPKKVKLGRCEEVEVTLDNKDRIRHTLMIPGLNPMFMLEFRGPGRQSARFVTPDEDVTLEFHCHVPLHEEMGMVGIFIVGKGGVSSTEHVPASRRFFEGEGRVIAADARTGQLVVDHKEIPGFMAAMIMGYPVQSPELLKGLNAGDTVKFKIDASEKKIVAIERLP